MYLVNGAEGFDNTSLRQGDILAGIPFPLMDHSKMHVLGSVAREYDYTALPVIAPRTHEHRADAQWVTLQVPARFCLCTVLSNCCDLEPRGGRVQAHMVTLARLRPVSNDIRNDAERFNSLRANKDPRDPDDPGYIDLFYLEAHAQLNDQDWAVHYNQVVTIPATDIALLLRKKIIQLDDRTRMKFKIKLAFTLGRSNDDEENAGLENPWDEPNPPVEAAPLGPEQHEP